MAPKDQFDLEKTNLLSIRLTGRGFIEPAAGPFVEQRQQLGT